MRKIKTSSRRFTWRPITRTTTRWIYCFDTMQRSTRWTVWGRPRCTGIFVLENHSFQAARAREMSDFSITLRFTNRQLIASFTRCAREDNMQACRILLSYNVDPSIVSLQGYTAAQIAPENVLKILQGARFANICESRISFRYS